MVREIRRVLFLAETSASDVQLAPPCADDRCQKYESESAHNHQRSGVKAARENSDSGEHFQPRKIHGDHYRSIPRDEFEFVMIDIEYELLHAEHLRRKLTVLQIERELRKIDHL